MLLLVNITTRQRYYSSLLFDDYSSCVTFTVPVTFIITVTFIVTHLPIVSLTRRVTRYARNFTGTETSLSLLYPFHITHQFQTSTSSYQNY
jgi:hypothetical protein